MENINSIIQFLEDNNITYTIGYDKTSIYCFDYPQDLRISYTDVEYERKGGDFKTVYNGNFRYDISWGIWNSYFGHFKKGVKTQNEVIRIIKQVKKQFMNRNEQLKLFW